MPWRGPAKPGSWQQPPGRLSFSLTLGLKGSPSAALSLCPSFSLLLQAHQLNMAPHHCKVFPSSVHQPAEPTWPLAPGPNSQERTRLAQAGFEAQPRSNQLRQGAGSHRTNLVDRICSGGDKGGFLRGSWELMSQDPLFPHFLVLLRVNKECPARIGMSTCP